MDQAALSLPPQAVVHHIPWESTPAEEARQIVQLCQQHGIRTGVVDHYRMDISYQESLNRAGLRWLQFGNRLHAHPLLGHLVHDASPNASAESYGERVVHAHTRFLTGPLYALVAPAFASLRARLQTHSRLFSAIETVLLTFGGGDDRGATLAALGWLDKAGFNGRRIILTSRANPSLPRLQQTAQEHPEIELQVDNWNPAETMARCQLAVCAGGTTLHELACLGIPAVITTLAENQFAPAAAWDAAGMGTYLGPLKDTAAEQAASILHHLLAQPGLAADMARTCLETQDGQGAARVARALWALDQTAETPPPGAAPLAENRDFLLTAIP